MKKTGQDASVLFPMARGAALAYSLVEYQKTMLDFAEKSDGNLKGREQRELTDDHPVIQIYEKRMNTISRYIKRGTLDEDLAEVMKKLAKDKMLRAVSNVAWC